MKIKNATLNIIQDGDRRVALGKGALTEHRVRKFYADALRRAAKSKAGSVTLTAIDSGDSFPLVGVAKILAQEILRFARYEKSPVQEITVCVPDCGAFTLFKKTIEGYINHVQEDLGLGPYVTVDIIIELKNGIILIERSNPPYGWALPGGFVEPFESLETAAAREAKEETNMGLKNLRQLSTYSDPHRDPRFHTVSTVFIGKGIGKPQFGDDAKGLKIVKYSELRKLKYAFDHGKIIRDYLAINLG